MIHLCASEGSQTEIHLNEKCDYKLYNCDLYAPIFWVKYYVYIYIYTQIHICLWMWIFLPGYNV